jgi:exodeoxyribonuclease V beta subunit
MKPLESFDISFSGINLVEASAGTGKTYNITSLYIRALIELDISVNKILVVTYTEAATKELKDRLLKRIRESIKVLKSNRVADDSDQFLKKLLKNVDRQSKAVNSLEKALHTFDDAAIHTIHGFCYQALQEQAFESRALYDAEMIGDDSELVLEAVDDYWRNTVSKATEDPLKRPLLKYLTDNYYRPEKLAQELGSYLGQPFLEIHPAETPSEERIEEEIATLTELFGEMKFCWDGEIQTILSLLKADEINGNKYPKNYLGTWVEKMDNFLDSEVAPVELIDKFDKFTQSTINDSLNKGATVGPEHSFFGLADEYQQITESLRNYEVIFKKQLLLHLRKELKEKKEELQVLSYDDLLLRLREALMDERRGRHLADKLREKYPLALVDEFQDTDPSQYDIFRRIYKPDPANSALYMIGDPKQSIYSFRGADVFSYLKAKRDAPKENTFNLERNFRSTPRLIKAINRLFGKHPNPFIFEQIPYEAVKPGKKKRKYDKLKEGRNIKKPIQFRRLSRKEQGQLKKSTAEERAAQDTADEIYRLIQEGKKEKAKIGEKPVEAKDIAVLVRRHAQAALISDTLQQRGIKSVQYSQQSVFESDEARQLETFLKAVAEPANETLLKTALSQPLTGFTANDLLDIEEDQERWISILDRFARWHKTWFQQGFSAMFRSVLKEAAVPEQLIKYSNGERRLTNVLHLGELLQAESQHQRDGARGLLKWLARKRKEDGIQQDEEQLRLESDRELVKIVTMHKSKGLEYPIVFCPFLWHGPEYKDNGQPLVYHDPEDYDKTYLDLNGKTDPSRDQKRWLMAREELSESLRLAYVAITRAKQCCYLTWVYAGKSEFSPLAYLFFDPETVFKSLKQTISEKYQPIGSQQIDEGISKLCESHPRLFSVSSDLDSADPQLGFEMEPKPLLTSRAFTRSTPLKPSYKVSSFSSLSSWMEEDPDMPDYDQFLDEPHPGMEDATNGEMTMFSFPKGPQPGTCIHKIFEDVDFRSLGDAEEVVAEKLGTYGIGPKWNDIVCQMLNTVVNAPLLPSGDGLKLAVLQKSDLIPEMEFYYRSTHIESRKLLSIIRENSRQVPGAIGKAAAGFLKGFIDLIFRFRGKYYILDYKTNYLGDSQSDYQREGLEQEILEASYDLQYHIYTIALHRFLEKNLPGYSYDKHFGGSFYLFLRGMNEQGREGIFFDRPDFSIIDELNHYISTGGQR